MSKFSLWTHAARPKTLWAAFAPVMIGTAMAYADGGLHGWSACVSLLFAILIQVGTNFCNDYADFKKGADTEERTGPVRVTQAGLIRPGEVLAATYIVYTLAVLVSLYLLSRVGAAWIVFVLVCVASGVLYTAGPRPLGYMGLGDIFVFIFFGPIAVLGTYYVQTQSLSWVPLVAGVGPGLLSVAILVVNNIRDRESDARAGKNTLVVRFGRRFGQVEYTVCVIGTLILVPVLVGATGGHAASLVSVLVLIPIAKPMYRVFVKEGEALNPVLGQTARALMIYSLLFAVGWVV